MMVRIAEFNMSENPGDRKWGEPGNQLTTSAEAEEPTFRGELQIVPFYGGWTACYRAIQTQVAEGIARIMEDAARNLNVGYSQYNGASPRTTFYDELKAAGWDAKKIRNKCNGDCSSGIAGAVNGAGVPVSKDMYTGIEDETLMSSGAFLRIDDERLVNDPTYRRRGDIMFKPGHTAAIIDDGPNSFSRVPLVVTGGSVWKRRIAGTAKYDPISPLSSGTFVYGTPQRDGRWILCSDPETGERAWISSTYLKTRYMLHNISGAQSWIRSAPNLDGDRITLLDSVALAPATLEEAIDNRGVYWNEVLTPDWKSYGWVSSKYTVLEENCI